jgi:hypothetical protein
MKVPTFYMDAKYIIQGDFDMYLSSKHDLFFRRIVEHINNRIEGIEKKEILCIIIDEDENIYELYLPEDGFPKAIKKSLDYFKLIEEYETCGFINELQKNL